IFALHFTLHSKPDTRSISARDRPGIRDTQPDPYGLPVSRSHSRSGVGEFSLGLSPISVGLRYLLHEIGPMTRNPERDTERSQVVRARSPSLSITWWSLFCSPSLMLLVPLLGFQTSLF